MYEFGRKGTEKVKSEKVKSEKLAKSLSFFALRPKKADSHVSASLLKLFKRSSSAIPNRGVARWFVVAIIVVQVVVEFILFLKVHFLFRFHSRALLSLQVRLLRIHFFLQR